MPSRNRRRTLRWLIVVQLAVVAVGITVLLVGFTFTKYIVDTPNLRRATLESDRLAIVEALRRGTNPAQWFHYTRYPEAYGLRIFSDDRAAPSRLIEEANPHLFGDAGIRPGGDDRSPQARPAEESRPRAALDSRPNEDRWMLSDHETIGDRSYWLHLIMIGDPAWRWRNVMAGEMMDHVAVPVLTIVPALALAMLLSIAIAVRPLTRISREAALLGAAVGSGGRLTPLNAEDLPVEFYQVVTAINAMLARLERALSLQKQFTSDAAHELRTPLTVLLLQVAELPPGPKVDSIREGLEDIARLVEQLLHLAQAEDTDEIERQPTDIVMAARKVCEELATVAHARRQTIEFEASDSAAAVPGHPVLVETAIRNVVGNALRHSPPNSIVAVTVDADSQVIVADQGAGIRDEHKELVFYRFWRADRRRSDGAGIGLALVRRIVEMHGGTVRIEDRTGGGTRFVLNFAGSDRVTASGGAAT